MNGRGVRTIVSKSPTWQSSTSQVAVREPTGSARVGQCQTSAVRSRLPNDERVSSTPDPDSGSKLLRWDHELLWTKELPSGDIFAPKVTPRKSEYLIFRLSP
ncbi:DUF6994 family protein [Pseudarthrobacter sp. S6]|uniref:DUF6994 family protein n=1 Tax=Pseudarthrobacter sp. S6 TaxID=3418420 RepID=UPI003CF578E3